MNWRRILLGLTLGTIGGTGFFLGNLPLPWMLGSMSACIAAALVGWRPAMPARLRSVMITILGVMLGSSFSPDLADQMRAWSLSLTVLLVSMTTTTVLCMAYFRHIGALGPVTAYFAAAPGGVNEMTVTGGAMGGDERTIALIHFLRILVIVATIPVAFRLMTGVASAPMSRAMGSLADLAPVDGLILLACAVGGTLAGHGLRLPAAGLSGPMAASTIVHLAGVTTSHPPAELIIAAQIVTGSGLGCRMVGLVWRDLVRTARLALGSTAIMITLSLGAAAALAAIADMPFAILVLAFVPGGIAEMSLIALALGQDVAFVATHHVLRVFLVILCAPLVFRLLRRRWR